MIPSSLEQEILREHFPSDIDYKAALERMEQGEPLAYIVGEWYFYGLTFRLNADTLIPRPDTELTVDELIRSLPRGAHFVDLGTGSGCIALSVLVERTDTRATLCDISANALKAAKENAERLGVADRCTFVECDMLRELPEGDFDAAVSNPPYIKSDVIPTLSRQVRHEPMRALDGGADGLDFYRSLLDRLPQRLGAGGLIVFEIGYDQRDDITALCRERGLECTVTKDYGGNDRVARINLASQ